MKIATYNIWNSENGMPYRRNYIIDGIKKIDADIICLQEVHNSELAENIAISVGYQYCYFDNFSNGEEGLCIMSNIPFIECESWLKNAGAIYSSFLYNGKIVAVINIHLPWNSVIEREKQIVNIVTAIDGKNSDYIYMAGDFNCTDTSDVQRFLLGECSLNNCEVKSQWFDLALSYAQLSNTIAEDTLNFRENPRFKKNTIEVNARFDRILLRNTYPKDLPTLNSCKIFGKTIYEDINLAASDHYGVVVEME